MPGQVAPGRVAVLLRGANTGGHRIEMARLRSVVDGLGFAPAATVLQSGNVVMSVPSAIERTVLVASLEAAFAEEFGFVSKVMVRDAAAMARCVADDPLMEVASRPAGHLVGFLSGVPDRSRAESLCATDYGPDLIRVVGDHVYMWCPDGLSKSLFFRMRLDRDLGVGITIRNWNTVTKLSEMVAA